MPPYSTCRGTWAQAHSTVCYWSTTTCACLVMCLLHHHRSISIPDRSQDHHKRPFNFNMYITKARHSRPPNHYTMTNSTTMNDYINIPGAGPLSSSAGGPCRMMRFGVSRCAPAVLSTLSLESRVSESLARSVRLSRVSELLGVLCEQRH